MFHICFKKVSEAKMCREFSKCFAHNYFMKPSVVAMTVKWFALSKEFFVL